MRNSAQERRHSEPAEESPADAGPHPPSAEWETLRQAQGDSANSWCDVSMSSRVWLPTILWALFIFVGSSIPGHEIPGQASAVSRFLHVIEFAVFGFLIARTEHMRNQHTPPWQVTAIALMVAVLYGITDEIHQAFVPGRQADGLDVAADTAGSVFGVAVWRFWKK